MYKTLGAAALLLAIFTFTSGNRFAGATLAAPSSPTIVASKAITGRTTMIPTATLFTASATGLYRVSAYLSMTTPSTNGCAWYFNVGWTDEAGAEEASGLENVRNNYVPPSDYGAGENAFTQTMIVRAVAGSGVTYSVPATGCSGDNGTYELFITAARLQ
jgi:hypothetical protein